MSNISKIEWTDKTWNPVRGCSVVSPGCHSCYAMKQAHRFSGPGRPYEGLTKQTKVGPQRTGAIRLVEEALLEPLRWRTPSFVFVNSMSDLFHESVPDVFIERVFSVMALAERHTFQVLTKRPERMRAWFLARRFDVKGYAILQTEQLGECLYAHPWPLPNVWLGVSVEDQRRADERIPLLLQAPAAVRFVSAEPLLGPVMLDTYLGNLPEDEDGAPYPGRLSWVIVGGESGPQARSCNVAWIRSIVRQCKDAGVPVFVKQLGSHWQGDPVRIRLRDRKGGDPSEWPEDLRVRQYPQTSGANG